MMGHSLNADIDGEFERVRKFLLALRPFVRAFDSKESATQIAATKAFGGMAWNGDGAYVIAQSPGHAADYVIPKEGGELWVDGHVIPEGATSTARLLPRVDGFRVQAEDQRDGVPLHVLRLTRSGARYSRRSSPPSSSSATPTSFLRPRRSSGWRRATSLPRARAARNRIWAEVKAGR